MAKKQRIHPANVIHLRKIASSLRRFQEMPYSELIEHVLIIHSQRIQNEEAAPVELLQNELILKDLFKELGDYHADYQTRYFQREFESICSDENSEEDNMATVDPVVTTAGSIDLRKCV